MNGDNAAERYVADRMSPEEVAEFEARMMAEPAVAADVDVRLRMKAGLSRLQERGELPTLLAVSNTRARLPRFALAASLAAVLVFVGVNVWRDRGAGPALVLLSQPSIAPAETFILAVTRNQAGPQQIRLRAHAPARLRVMPDPEASGPYRIEVSGLEQTFTASADGFVDVHLEALTPGTLDATLELIPAQGPSMRFDLRIIVSP